MSTNQNYDATASLQTSVEQTAPETAKTPIMADDRQPELLTAEEFIAQNPDLRGLAPGQLVKLINQRLLSTPVHYANVLSGIALLRAFVPDPAEAGPEHYALLLQDWQVIGLTWILAETDRYQVEQELTICYRSETRPLMEAIVQVEANKVLLATTRNDGQYMLFDEELLNIGRLRGGLDVFGVEMLDYLLLYEDLNVSRTWAEYGEEGMDEGVNINQLEHCGLSSETAYPLGDSTTY